MAKIKAVVYGELLKSFDTLCVTESIGESAGIRDCIRAYLKYYENKNLLTINDEPVKDDKTFKRQIQCKLSGVLLRDFKKHCMKYMLTESTAIREAIKIKTIYGKRYNISPEKDLENLDFRKQKTGT